jgi:hypothetical protein
MYAGTCVLTYVHMPHLSIAAGIFSDAARCERGPCSAPAWRSPHHLDTDIAIILTDILVPIYTSNLSYTSPRFWTACPTVLKSYLQLNSSNCMHAVRAHSIFSLSRNKHYTFRSVHKDIVRVIVRRQVSLYTSLVVDRPVISAFDSVDHPLKSSVLYDRFSPSGMTLSWWFRSYLSDPIQWIVFAGHDTSDVQV